MRLEDQGNTQGTKERWKEIYTLHSECLKYESILAGSIEKTVLVPSRVAGMNVAFCTP